MKPADKQYLLNLLSSISEALCQTFGKNCEIVIHDLESPESSIVAIANGGLTGRKVGDTLDVLGFQLLKASPASNLLNYKTKTKDGRQLRSSSVFLRDEKGEAFCAMCINIDISDCIKGQEWLQEAIGPGSATIEEGFEHTVDEVLETMMQDAISSIGKSTSDLTREDKIAIVAHLEARGAFLVRYSVERLAELLEMTKYSIYNYLDEIKKRQEGQQPSNSKAGKLPAKSTDYPVIS
jgi:predicted transcriptional regulator YheO